MALPTTTSITGTLAGIAQADGDLDSHGKASQHIPRPAGTPAADVTIGDLLSDDPGRHGT